ncbi:MAG: ABC transporter permease subunit [Lachnospiraceae bacterium]
MEKKLDIKKLVSQNSIWLVLILMVVVMTFLSKSFLTIDNITNMLITEAIIGILCMGVFWTILSKGIDLSPGAVVAFAGGIAASLAQLSTFADRKYPNLPQLPVILIVIIALAIGTIFGLVNGLLIAYTGIPPFIATLGTQLIARAFTYIYNNSYPISQLTPEFKSLGQGKIFGFIPMTVFFFVIIVIISGFMLTQTRFGKNVYAIGGNDQAARVAGINVEKNLVKIYVWSALCASIGGVLLVARSGAGTATLGLNYELDAIAAATVGGTSHTGGVARISGIIAGILILGILKNGMLLLGINAYWQQAFKGLIIIAAVVFDMRKNRKKV